MNMNVITGGLPVRFLFAQKVLCKWLLSSYFWGEGREFFWIFSFHRYRNKMGQADYCSRMFRASSLTTLRRTGRKTRGDRVETYLDTLGRDCRFTSGTP